MKNLLILFLFSMHSIYGQTDNFTIKDNKKVIWQNVINDTTNVDQLYKNLKFTGKFDRIEIINNSIEFGLRYNQNDFIPFGFKAGKEAQLFNAGGYCRGDIEFKDNKYRVTVFNIDINEPISGTGLGIQPIETYLFKANGELKANDRFKRVLSYYNQFFSSLFQPKKASEEW